jgi:hypothetical protein
MTWKQVDRNEEKLAATSPLFTVEATPTRLPYQLRYQTRAATLRGDRDIIVHQESIHSWK